LIKLLMQRDV